MNPKKSLILIFLSLLVLTIGQGASLCDPGPAPVAVPLIDGPDKLDVKEAELYQLFGADSAQLATYQFVTYPAKAGARVTPMTQGSSVFLYFKSPVAGPQAIIGVVAGKLVIKEIQIGGGKPKPNPPNPGPGPSPAPGKRIAAGKLWLITVVPNATKQTATIGAIVGSKRIHAALNAHGDHFRWVDAQTAPADLAPWVANAQALGIGDFGRMMVIDQDTGKVVDSLLLSDKSTDADAIKLLQTWEAL